MSGYARLRPLLDRVARGSELGPRQLEVLAGDGEPGPPLQDDAYALQARDELRRARAVLRAVAANRPQRALDELVPLLDQPLRPTPFESLLEQVGARLAADSTDAELTARFLERRRAMQERFATGAALVGALALLGRPDLVAALAAQLDDGADGAQDQDAHADAAAVGWPGGWTPPQSSRLVPFATVDEPQTPAYVVTLRHLADARTATFAVHRVIWHDLEGDDPTVSDLVLAFESDAGAMLRAIDPEALRLRLFFGAGPSYDEVATADASLFDVEVNPLEGRIYLKLRRPPAWAATELPPDELWRHLRSCVLITEPE